MSGKYIVVFKQHVDQETINQHIAKVNNNGGEVTQCFDRAVLPGFAAHIPDQHLQHLQSLQSEDIIDYIEQDQVVTTQ